MSLNFQEEFYFNSAFYLWINRNYKAIDQAALQTPQHMQLRANKPVSQMIIMGSSCKRFVWQATHPVNTADCMSDGRYFYLV